METENHSEEEFSGSEGNIDGEEESIRIKEEVDDEEIDEDVSIEEPEMEEVEPEKKKTGNRRNQMFKSRTPAKIETTQNSDEELSNNESFDEYSSSETEGEIEIPIEVDMGDDNRNPEVALENQEQENKYPDIIPADGQPIPVVTIKQEYDEDEEMLFKEDEEMLEEGEEQSGEDKKDVLADKKEGIIRRRRRKGPKPEATDEDLRKINIRLSFICQLCSEKCADTISLGVHMKTLHSDQIGTYMCATCQRVYQTADSLRAHMLCHVQLGSYECTDCKKIYHHPASLMSHRRRWHKKEGQPHECKQCGKTYSILSDLNTHMKSHTPQSFPCKHCDKAFRTERYLRLHTRHIHLGHKQLKLECKVCHKSFQKKSLATHMKTHQAGNLHKCHYCGKCVTTQYSLMAHVRRHEGVKPFVCHICEKGFVDKGKLARHINSHSGSRDFQCDVCKKTFSEKQYLRQHRRTHDEAKDHPCRMCGAIFKSLNSVWSHMRKHTQSDRYKCHLCGKTCYRPDHLRSHMVSHTGVKEYQCEICSKRFAKPYDLTEHMRSHSGEKPFPCTLCDRAFARHGEFRKHKMSKYHREREIEAGLPPSFPVLPPRPPKSVAIHHCGSCDKKFSKIEGLEAHLRRKSHVAKEANTDVDDDTYHDQEGFDDPDDTELQSIPALQIPSHDTLQRLRQALEANKEKVDS